MTTNNQTPRRAWQRPAVQRLTASTARMGPTPINPEGPFAQAS